MYPRCVQDVYNYLSPVPTGFRALQRREVIQCLTPSNDTVFAPIVIVDAKGPFKKDVTGGGREVSQFGDKK